MFTFVQLIKIILKSSYHYIIHSKSMLHVLFTQNMAYVENFYKIITSIFATNYRFLEDRFILCHIGWSFYSRSLWLLSSISTLSRYSKKKKNYKKQKSRKEPPKITTFGKSKGHYLFTQFLFCRFPFHHHPFKSSTYYTTYNSSTIHPTHSISCQKQKQQNQLMQYSTINKQFNLMLATHDKTIQRLHQCMLWHDVWLINVSISQGSSIRHAIIQPAK